MILLSVYASAFSLACASTPRPPYVRTVGPTGYWNSNCDLRTSICMMAAAAAPNGRIVFRVGRVLVNAPDTTRRSPAPASTDTTAHEAPPAKPDGDVATATVVAPPPSIERNERRASSHATHCVPTHIDVPDMGGPVWSSCPPGESGIP
jgi:hypothetical protein